MRFLRNRLYSFAFPLAIFLLPLMEASFDQVPAYLKGTEFRTLIGEFIIQVVTGILDAFIVAGVAILYAIFGGGTA